MTIMLKIAKTLFDFPFSWAMPEFKSMLESELGTFNHCWYSFKKILLTRASIAKEPNICLKIILKL